MSIEKTLIRAKEIIDSLTDEQFDEIVDQVKKLESRTNNDSLSGILIMNNMVNEAARKVANIDEELGEKKLEGQKLFEAVLNRTQEIGMQTGKDDGAIRH